MQSLVTKPVSTWWQRKPLSVCPVNNCRACLWKRERIRRDVSNFTVTICRQNRWAAKKHAISLNTPTSENEGGWGVRSGAEGRIPERHVCALSQAAGGSRLPGGGGEGGRAEAGGPVTYQLRPSVAQGQSREAALECVSFPLKVKRRDGRTHTHVHACRDEASSCGKLLLSRTCQDEHTRYLHTFPWLTRSWSHYKVKRSHRWNIPMQLSTHSTVLFLQALNYNNM